MNKKRTKIENILYDFNKLKVRIKNIEIDLYNLSNDITIKAVTYEERTGSTNTFNSTVENEVIRREEKVKKEIDYLKAKLKHSNDLKLKIESSLNELSTIERKLIELRYFSRDKKTWLEIGMTLGFDKDYCIKIKNKALDKIYDMIYY